MALIRLGTRPKMVGGEKSNWSLVINYSIQHYAVENIIWKLWSILKNDPILSTVLPDCLSVIYKGLPTLRDKIAPIVLDSPVRPTSFFGSLVSFYPGITHFLSCSTKNVVYLIWRPCGMQYVGRTQQACALQVRLNEHVAYIRRGFPGHYLSRHYAKCHYRNPEGTLFMAIDRYLTH